MGPVLGGILYSAYGIQPVLIVCMICFVLSAVMEIFIQIPFQKQDAAGSIWQIVKNDFTESFRFIWKEKPVIGKAVLIACGINLFLSSMIVVALPYVVTEVIDLEAALANRLYGFAQGIMAAGGLAGGICAGIFAKRLSIQKAGNLLLLSAVCLLPASASLLFISSGIVNYIVLTVCCFVIMACATVFTVQMLSFFQMATPARLIGKVMALILTVSMCAQPLGNALYGVLFEISEGAEWAVILFACVVSMMIAMVARKVVRGFAQDGEIY